MNFSEYISSLAIPLVIFLILIVGLVRKVNVFEVFCSGAKDGLSTALSITAPIIALMCAISALRTSGVLDYLAKILAPVTSFIGLDKELLPLALLRPISGSGSLGIVSSIISRYGADSIIAKTACVMAGSTETTFYTLAVYFGSVGIKHTRHSMWAALFTDVVCIVTSVIVCSLFFK